MCFPTGFYGDRGIAALKNRMREIQYCFETEVSIDNKQTEAAFLQMTQTLLQEGKKAKVVVCFCQGETVAGLLRAMKTLGLQGEGILILGT